MLCSSSFKFIENCTYVVIALFRCYDEESGDVVYIISHPFNPASMKYFSGRLFCIGKGAMSVLDFTESTITNAQVCIVM